MGTKVRLKWERKQEIEIVNKLHLALLQLPNLGIIIKRVPWKGGRQKGALFKDPQSLGILHVTDDTDDKPKTARPFWKVPYKPRRSKY